VHSEQLLQPDHGGGGDEEDQKKERSRKTNLGLALVLKSRDNVAVLPADLGGDLSQLAGGTTGAKTEDGEGLGNNELLLLVEGGRATLEDAELLEGEGTTLALVGAHSAEGAEEHL